MVTINLSNNQLNKLREKKHNGNLCTIVIEIKYVLIGKLFLKSSIRIFMFEFMILIKINPFLRFRNYQIVNPNHLLNKIRYSVENRY